MNLLLRWAAIAASVLSVGASAQDAIDDVALQKAGASQALAEEIVTEVLYEQLTVALAGQSAELLRSEAQLSALHEKDPGLFAEAEIAATRRLAPRPLIIRGYAAMLSEGMAYSDLKEALRFMRTPQGKRFWQAVNDASAMERAMDSIPAPPEDEVKRVLTQELLSRFPGEKLGLP